MTNIDPNNIAKIIFQDILAITSKNVLAISDAANESSLVIDRAKIRIDLLQAVLR